jgi:DEAD/DEAH box helicase domain-containing protein
VTDDKQIDYAAPIRAARTEIPQHPDWLAVGKQIYSTEHGIGEVLALLGKWLIIRFLEDVNPVQFCDWVSQVESNSLVPSNTAIALHPFRQEP